jgi:hypothetical protein
VVGVAPPDDEALEGGPFARGERGQQAAAVQGGVVVGVDEVEERGDGLKEEVIFFWSEEVEKKRVVSTRLRESES